ncbi:hyaluronan mediated motility receptor-like [Ischnura elegans]|uniref:hyaluronan mediated motility receptor-like n=1 Tax=Ischnura elegans TaxID=197161 RepID=UPI001ED888E4|nr:hyaluronan mediated motility receptor-like [Ischnura elegans]
MTTFPRAKLCRFNEVPGCAPPPGTYEPKLCEKLPLGLFDRSERFTSPKQPTPKICSQSPERRSSLQSNDSKVKNSPGLHRSQSVRCSRTKRHVTDAIKRRDRHCECNIVKLPAEMVSVESTANLPCSRCAWFKKTRSKSLYSLKKLQGRIEAQMNKIQSQDVKQDEIKKIIKELADVIPNYEAKLRDIEAEKEALKEIIQSLQSQIFDQRYNICTLTDCLDELTAAGNLLINQKTEYMEEMKQKDVEIYQSHTKVVMLKDELAFQKLKNTEMSSKIYEMVKDLQNSMESVSKLKEEVAVAQLALANKTEECQQLENIARSSKEDLSSIQHALESKTKECLQLEEQVAQCKEAKEEHVTITELLCSVQEQCDNHKRAYDALADRADKVYWEYDALKKSHDHLIENAEESMSSMLEKIKNNFSIDSDDETQEVSSPLKVSDSRSRLVLKYLADLRTAVGRVMEITFESQERNCTLERELGAKNDEIQGLELLIGPFREQLKEYEQERQALTAVTNKTKKELIEISLQQAASLGHQNHKQKIKYLVQLKEANLKLKEEVTELQAKLSQKDRMLWRLTKVGAPGFATPRGLTVRGKENSGEKK